MENWNTGFWGSGEMVYWENVANKNIRKKEASFEKHHSNTPSFHYSMYRARTQSPKTSLTSMTFEYYHKSNNSQGLDC